MLSDHWLILSLSLKDSRCVDAELNVDLVGQTKRISQVLQSKTHGIKL